MRRVGDDVGDGNENAWVMAGAQPARVAKPAHPADQVRPALERENPACDEGDQQVGHLEDFGVGQLPESGDGGGSSRRQRPGPIGPLGPPPSRRASYVSRQWTLKKKEPSQDHISGHLPKEHAKYWRT